jgi:ribosomal protein S1
VVELDSLDGIPVPSHDAWQEAKRRFPLGASATERVLGRQPFGVFLDLGASALGLMEMPALPKVAGPEEVVYPQVGTELTGVVVRHRETGHQVELVSEDPVSELFRQRLHSALRRRSDDSEWVPLGSSCGRVCGARPLAR